MNSMAAEYAGASEVINKMNGSKCVWNGLLVAYQLCTVDARCCSDISGYSFHAYCHLPTNKQLLDSGLDRNSARTHELLVRWGKLHAVRTVASLTATAVFLIATLGAQCGSGCVGALPTPVRASWRYPRLQQRPSRPNRPSLCSRGDFLDLPHYPDAPLCVRTPGGS
jgi:hypothetical protein